MDHIGRPRTTWRGCGAFGYTIVEPASGELASGQSGVGRLTELPEIVDAIVAAIGERPIRAPDPAARRRPSNRRANLT